MSALNSQGSKILHSSGGVGDSPSSYTAIENVISISGPDGSASLIDVSNLSSTRKEYLPGLADNGQIQLSCNFTAGTKQMELFDNFNANADAEPFEIQIPTSAGASTYHRFRFNAIVTKWSLAEAVDQKVTLNITLQTTGGVSYLLS